VTFDIDANGILNVTAADKASGRSQHITITASSGLSESEVEKMRREAESHKDEDSKRKELIEVRNHADNVIYTAEKTLRDFGDKVPADLKSQIESSSKDLKELMNKDDVAAIRNGAESLGQLIQKVGAGMYQQPGGPQQGPGGPSDAGGTDGPSGGPSAGGGPNGGEDVVDGEFRNA